MAITDELKFIHLITSPAMEVNTFNYIEGYGQTSAVLRLIIKRDTSTVPNLNDIVTIELGYTDSYDSTFFRGRLKSKTYKDDGEVELIIKDILVDATDFFIVSEDPEAPLSYDSKTAEFIVEDLLAQANISNFVANVPLTFTYGLNKPAEFNLLSAADAINQIAGMLAWHVWADWDTVYFRDIKPYYRTGAQKDTEYGQTGNTSDTITHYFCNDGTITGPDYKTMLSISNVKTDEGLRNKVVVYGVEGVKASASASSPYLPADFYKTAVISSFIIDSNDLAQAAANFNLILYNKLTETVQIQALGNPNIRARQFCQVEDTATGTSGIYFIYDVSHSVGPDGYTTRLNLVK